MAQDFTHHPGPYRIHLIPHSHLDVEWYWTFDKTRAWSRTIFRDMLRLLRDDSDEAFTQDQAPLLELVAEACTADEMQELRRWVEKERFEAACGGYVQPEVAEPHGECLIRQLLVGRERARELFGVAPTTGWFIDTFGQIPQIAQILAGCGIQAFVFMRGIPPEHGEPPNAFWYESPDGTRILTNWLAAGYGVVEGNLEHALAAEIGHASSADVMLCWGADVSNPAHMPAANAKVSIEKVAAKLGIPIESVTITTPSAYFRKLRARANDLPVLRCDFAPPEDRFADLRGTYSSRVRLKVANRKAEGRLLTAEAWDTLASALTRPDSRAQAILALAWERLLYNHFHDIIGGSCTDQVYEKALRRFGTVIDLAEDIADRALDSLVAKVDTTRFTYPIAVFNPTSSPRTDVVEFEMVFRDEPTDFRIVDDEGGDVPFVVSALRGSRLAKEGKIATVHITWLASEVPASGYRLFGIEAMEGRIHAGPEVGAGRTAENEWFRVTVNPQTGDLASIVDRATDEEFLRGPGNEIVARREKNPSLEGMVRVTGEEDRTSAEPATVETTSERTNLFERVRTRRTFLDCAVIREATLFRGVRRISFRTVFEGFRGGDVLVSVRFAAAVNTAARRFVYETPYAMTERNDRYHCAQTVVDLSDDEKGLALINTGNAGCWPVGTALDLILFRSLRDFPDYYAPLANEHGTHIFEYAVVPHRGDWREGNVVQAGHAANRPLTAFLTDRHAGDWEPCRSLIAVSPPTVEVSAVKRSHDGQGIAIRLYETVGRDVTAALALGFPVRSAWRATFEEERTEAVIVSDGKVRVPLRGFEIGTVIVEGG